MGVKESREELGLDKRTRNEYGKAAISEPMLDEKLTFQGEGMMEKKDRQRKRQRHMPKNNNQRRQQRKRWCACDGHRLCPPYSLSCPKVQSPIPHIHCTPTVWHALSEVMEMQ